MRPERAGYRPDIDGLRAFAVLCVVCHHLVPGQFKAGFIGVDVFFVLSGYLITGIVHEEAQAGRFSYIEFYWRRCRRIIPALVVVLAATWVLGALLLTGPEFESLGRHVIAAGTFSSNILLWREAGYFDASAYTKPLLHLWSLGIEEQFYLIWPSVLVLLAARKRPNVWVLGIGAVSLAAGAVTSVTQPTFAFYMLPTRFWELLAGGALAIASSDLAASKTRKNSYTELLAGVGVLLLVAALVLIDNTRAFPGLWALLPVLGTVSLLAAGPTATLNRVILSHPWAVWVGLISYPLYLWHWPLLSLAHILGDDLAFSTNEMRVTRVLLVLLAIILAQLTYRFVELPTQQFARGLSSARKIRLRGIRIAIIPLAALGMLGLVTTDMHGFPSRYSHVGLVKPDSLLALASRQLLRRDPAFRLSCETDASLSQPEWCFQSKPTSPSVAVFGDSHARVAYPGLAAALGGASVMMVGESGCAPALDVVISVRSRRLDCVSSNRQAMAILLRTATINTVVLSARWPLYVTGVGFGSAEPDLEANVAGLADRKNQDVTRTTVLMEGLMRSISTLEAAGKHVIILETVPELGFRVEDCVVGRPMGLRPPRAPCARAKAASSERLGEVRALTSRIRATFPSVRAFDPVQLFCPELTCNAIADGQALYSDDKMTTISALGGVTCSDRPWHNSSAPRGVG